MNAPRSLPIADACTLPTEDRPFRVAEFDQLFSDSFVSGSWAGPRLRLELAGPTGLADRVRDLTARESACCSFFDFAVIERGERVVLDVGVDATHGAVLDGLAAALDVRRVPHAAP